MKICYRCKLCKDRDNYERHLANVRRTSDARIAKTRAVIHTLLQTGCVDCGNRDIRVLEFDHVRGEKLRGVGELVRWGAGLDVVMAEIAKCEIRCRNCHVIATFTRRGHTWHDDYL